MTLARWLFCCTLVPCVTACASRHRIAEPEPVDDWDQEQWATTSAYGDGSESSSGYYGVGSSSSEPTPSRIAADPQPRSNTREPASPRSRPRVER